MKKPYREWSEEQKARRRASQRAQGKPYREWSEEEKERRRAYERAHPKPYREMSEQQKERRRAYARAHPKPYPEWSEDQKERQRANARARAKPYAEWTEARKDKNRARNRARHRRTYVPTGRAYSLPDTRNPMAVTTALIALYGGRCGCCDESARPCLTLDHVNGDGHVERGKGGGDAGWKRNLLRRIAAGALDPGYRVLCFNCNIARHNWGYCHGAPVTSP